MQVVWFKRDLRLADHRPLWEASRRGPCLCLYIYEPQLLHSPEFDASHLLFINQSLQELASQLRRVGGQLAIRHGTVPEVLDELHHQHGIEALLSHEETGNSITYARDLQVAAWAKRLGIEWNEFPQSGVIRKLRSRDGWAKRREYFLKQPLAPTPTSITCPRYVDSGRLQSAEELGLTPTNKEHLQAGGVAEANQVLSSFLEYRGQDYSSSMSSPVTAFEGCSRLSPYIAWGCLSVKQIVQELGQRRSELRDAKAAGEHIGNWQKSLRSFESRLSWHCHFMQKLEDEPEIEFQNMSRAYDGLREDEFDPGRFEAWCEGRTGYPLVDACMRALLRGSWINFRMRAMLVSFASYHLWLHWRPTAVFLARHFLDFEPGIHFSQFQMQSGTTGINTVRIYSPIKQVHDQDPEGKFIRAYVPELAAVPNEYIAEPHKMPLSLQGKVGCVLGKDYPRPIVEHATAYRQARERIYAVRRESSARNQAKEIMRKHGSRKRPTRS